MAAPHLPSEEVILIPKDFPSLPHRQETVNRYKQLRLHGLKVDPASFSSTHEQESQFSHETWQDRILNHGSKTFVAVTRSDVSLGEPSNLPSSGKREESHGALKRLLEKEWVGIVTLLGPVGIPEQRVGSSPPSAKPWQMFIKDGKYQIPPSVPATEDLKGAHVVYLIVGMFVLPHSRRKGHARRLLDAAAKAVQVEAQMRGTAKATITVEVQSSNAKGKQLYERAGYNVEDDAVAMKNPRGETSYVKSLAQSFDLT